MSQKIGTNKNKKNSKEEPQLKIYENDEAYLFSNISDISDK